MNASSQGIGSDDQRVQAAAPRPGWLASVVLGALLLFVYLINGRPAALSLITAVALSCCHSR
jgi:hypothetical protein